MRARREVRGWWLEAALDWTCLMVGVNYCWRRGDFLGVYVHLGPAIVGAYRWDT